MPKRIILDELNYRPRTYTPKGFKVIYRTEVMHRAGGSTTYESGYKEKVPMGYRIYSTDANTHAAFKRGDGWEVTTYNPRGKVIEGPTPCEHPKVN